MEVRNYRDYSSRVFPVAIAFGWAFPSPRKQGQSINSITGQSIEHPSNMTGDYGSKKNRMDLTWSRTAEALEAGLDRPGSGVLAPNHHGQTPGEP